MRIHLLSVCLAILLTVLALVSVGCAGRGREITVAGAASMADVLRSLDTLVGSVRGMPKITVASGASNVLARLLREGAPYDIFVSLDPAIVTALAREGLLDSATTVEVARNRLVVASRVAPDTIYTSFHFLLRFRRIAVASEGVPLRTYSEQALRKSGLWDSVAPQLVYGADARQVAGMVANGDVDAGIVYATDARQQKLNVLYSIPPELHDPIRIVAANRSTASRNQPVQRVMEMLGRPEFRARLAAQGFDVEGRR